VVVFNIDMSGSMAGSRWAKTKKAVEGFTRFLGEEDFVCGITFNDKV
jgi:hypothetical protein